MREQGFDDRDRPLIDRMRGWLQGGPVYLEVRDRDIDACAETLVAAGEARREVRYGARCIVQV